MKKITKKILSVIMMITLLVTTLAGCGGDKVSTTDKLALPGWVSELIAQHGELDDDKKAVDDYNVNFYFDSTVSMAGYAGIEGNTVHPVGEKFTLLMNAFRDTNRMFNSNTFYKIGIEAGSPSWVENAAGFADCRTHDFYAYGDEYNSLNSIGPLSLLFYQNNSKFNYDDVNIISSDLAEQNVNLTSLAEVLQKNVLSKPGYTVYLLAVKMPFSGLASYTDPNSNALTSAVIDTQDRPLYFILTGPSSAVDYYYTQFCNDFGRHYTEGKDFFVSKFDQTGGVKTVMYNKIKTTAAWEDMLVSKTWDGLFDNKNSQWNMNLNLRPLDSNEFNSNFVGADGQPIAPSGKVALNAFEYLDNSKGNATGTGRMVLNYYIPIEASEGDLNPEDIEFWVNHEKYEETSSPAVNEAKSQQNFMNYSYLEYVENESATSNKERNQKTPVWNDSLSGNLDKVNAEELDIDYSVELLRAGDIPAYVTTYVNQRDITANLKAKSKESRFYDESFTMGKGEDNKEFISQPLFTEEDYDGTFTEDTMVVHICVKGYVDGTKYANIKLSGDKIVFDLPVYALDTSKVNVIPEWTSEFDTGMTEDYGLTHTYNFEIFYKTLFNVGTNNEELQKYACSTLITDIITVIA